MSTVRRRQAHLERLLQRGDHGAFVRALEPLCHREIRRVATNGIEPEDLLQEARIACLQVARHWRPDRGANPLTLAVLAIRRDLWKVTRQQLAHKRRLHQTTLSLDRPAPAADKPLLDSVRRRELEPAEAIAARDTVIALHQHVARLPHPERVIGEFLLAGRPATHAAPILGVSPAWCTKLARDVRDTLRSAA